MILRKALCPRVSLLAYLGVLLLLVAPHWIAAQNAGQPAAVPSDQKLRELEQRIQKLETRMDQASKALQDQSKQKIEHTMIAAMRRGAKAEEVVTKSFTTEAIPRLVVETFNGHIEVTTAGKGAVKAKVVKTVKAGTEEAAKEDLKNINVQMTQDANTIHIIAKSEGRHLTDRGAAIEVQVPPGSTLDLRTSNGKAIVAGPIGDTTVFTSNGEIVTKGSNGKLTLRTSNGCITAEGDAGALDLRTSNGRIEIRTTEASVTARTSNGTIHFTGLLKEGEHTFQTSNGNIELILPSDAQFRVDAHTSLGKVASQFQVKGSQSKNKTDLKGTVGENPATTIHLQTSLGNIEVRPATGSRASRLPL